MREEWGVAEKRRGRGTEDMSRPNGKTERHSENLEDFLETVHGLMCFLFYCKLRPIVAAVGSVVLSGDTSGTYSSNSDPPKRKKYLRIKM